MTDVLTSVVLLDTDLEHSLEPFEDVDEDEDDIVSGAARIPVVTNGNSVKGVVRVTAPAGHTVWHGGVTCKLESNLIDFERSKGQELVGKTLTVAEEEYVNGSRDYPFDFFEGIGVGSGRFRESFEGDHYALRHGLVVSVARPWYTFPVQRYLSFGAQELHHEVSEWDLLEDAAAQDETALPRPGNTSPRRRTASGSLDGEGEEGGAPGGDVAPGRLTAEDRAALEAEEHLEVYNAVVGDAMEGVASSTGPVLSVPDCGGIAVFDMGKDVFSLNATLSGVVRFAFLVHPVTRVTLRVIKEESIGGETFTDQVFAADLLNAALYDGEEEAALLATAAAAGDAAGAGKVRAGSGGAAIVDTDGAGLSDKQAARLAQIQQNAPLVGQGELNVSLDLAALVLSPSTLEAVPGTAPEEDAVGADAAAVAAEEDAASDESDDSDYVSDVQIAKYKAGTPIAWPVLKYYLQLVVSNQQAGDEEEEAEEAPELPAAVLATAREYTEGMVAAHREAGGDAGQDKGAGSGGDGEGKDGALPDAGAEVEVEDGTGEGAGEGAPTQSVEEEAAALTEGTPRGLFFNTHEVIFYRDTWSATYIPPDKRLLSGVTQTHEDGGAAAEAAPELLMPASPTSSAGAGTSPHLAALSPARAVRPASLGRAASDASVHSGPPVGAAPLTSPVDSVPGAGHVASHVHSPITPAVAPGSAEV